MISRTGHRHGIPMLLLLLALSWVMPATANAAVRILGVDDPLEAPPVLDGTKQPDLSRVSATYDDAGAITLTMDFAESVPAAKSDSRLDFWVNVSFFQRDRNGCPDAMGNAAITSYSTLGSAATAKVAGFDGSGATTGSFSADGRQATWGFVHPAIANRDYRCMSLRIYGSVRSTASNISSRYSSSCDCWYVFSDYDTIDTAYFTRPDGSTLQDLSLSGAAATQHLRVAIQREFNRAPLSLGTACLPGMIVGTRNCQLRWRDALFTYRGSARVERRVARAVVSWYYSMSVTQVRIGCRPTLSARCRKRIVRAMRFGGTGVA